MRLARFGFAISLVSLLGLGCKSAKDDLWPSLFGHSKAAAGPYSYSLAGNGINDTNLNVACCPTDPSLCTVNPKQYCLHVESAILDPPVRDIPLFQDTPQTTERGARPLAPDHTTTFDYQPDIHLIGDHTGDGLQKVALTYVREREPSYTLCRYSWPDPDTGWRSHSWSASDCSNGLPGADWQSIGQGQNGTNSSGVVQCNPGAGAHYQWIYYPDIPYFGAASATVTCLFVPRTAQQAKPNITVCTYYWPDSAADVWRYHTWDPSDCSNGLPTSGTYVVGSGSNGRGTGGMATCTPTQGGHFNLGSLDGPTSSQVWCAYLDPPVVTGPSVTRCEHEFTGSSAGARTWTWTEADCSHGLPTINAAAIGQATNATGAPQQATCSATSGTHYNTTATTGRVRCLYVSPHHFAPALAVIDVNTQSILADAASPYRVSRPDPTASAFYPRGPGGTLLAPLRHPAITPSYGDDSTTNYNWAFGCLWKQGQSSAECGNNMIKIDTSPTSGYWFREVGGMVQDVDGTGWEAMNLIYHYYQKAISSNTGQALTSTYYDIATAGGDYSQPVGFHSGRNYGSHSAITWPDSRPGTLMAGSDNPGRFDNVFCNVSRFLGALCTPGAPSSRFLRWSRYLGFHSNSWTSLPPVPWGSPAPTPSRWGDFAHHCIHTYHDASTVVDGIPSMLYNYFTADYSPTGINGALSSRCKDEQYQLYMEGWSQRSQNRWYACSDKHQRAKGYWGMQVIRQDNNADVTGSPYSYVWGWTDQLKPTTPPGQILYLVENMPATIRFDHMQDPDLDLTPAMTSPTTPPPNAVVSSSNSSDEQREFSAFDKDLQTPDYRNEWVTANGVTAAWIYFDFGAGNSQVVNRYSILSTRIYNLGSAPKDWTFEGSNDAATWTTLQTKTGQTDWFLGETRSFAVSNRTAYRYYRLNVTANNGFPSYLVIREIGLYTVKRVPATLVVNSIVGGLWRPHGAFPVAGQPVYTYFGNSGQDGYGQGSYTSLIKLVLEDRDGDGYPEVLIEKPDASGLPCEGQCERVWVGWSISQGEWVVVP